VTRFVLPSLVLARLAILEEAHARGRTVEVLQLLHGAGLGVEERGVPVGVRWTVQPSIGLPRGPFTLWRMAPAKQMDVKTGDVDVPGRLPLTLPGGPWRIVEATADSGGGNLEVQALRLGGHPIPGQRVTLAPGQRCRVRAPGITGLLVTGSGRLVNIAGISDHGLANRVAWRRRQLVGLPWAAGEIAQYDTQDQGWLDPVWLRPPPLAAQLRLEVARALFLPPAATGSPTLPAPAWPAPDPGLYLAALRDPAGPLGLAAHVRDALDATDDADPARQQRDFQLTGVGTGPRPIGTATAPSTVDLTVPVMAVAAIATAADTWTATGLGLGTADILPEQPPPPPDRLVRPPGLVEPVVEHMVTCELWSWLLNRRIEVAAIAEVEGRPAPAQSFAAAGLTTDQPATLDAGQRRSVRLSWSSPPRPQAYALQAGRPGGPEVLNDPSPAGGWIAHIPVTAGVNPGQPAPALEAAFLDTGVMVDPAAGTVTPYTVAAIDVFGRWSPWAAVTHTAAPPPVQRPGLEEARFVAAAGATGGLPGDLVVDVTWDWTSRRPDRIELSGCYVVPSPTPLPMTIPSGWQRAPGGVTGAVVTISFDPSGAATLTAPAGGVVTPVALPAPDPPLTGGLPARDLRRYRVRVAGMQPAFAAVGGVLGYAVTARGAERVRPVLLSDAVGPVAAELRDPTPPPQPALPPGIQWTALPDPSGVARGVLQWPAVAGAVGYVVWEAGETALLHAVAPGATPPTPSQPILTRATALRAAVAAAPERSLRAFSRLTPSAITATRLEVSLAGRSDTMQAYRVSAVSAQGMESSRSAGLALFAVPRRAVPGTPQLTARAIRDATGPGVAVEVVAGPGPMPASFRIHRVNRESAARNTGEMGPPALTLAPGMAGVTETTQTLPDGTVLTRLSAVDRGVSPRWAPYHYRAVAVGRSVPASGVLAGESSPSGTWGVVLAPALPPTASLTVRTGAAGRVVDLTTDLPAAPTPAGEARTALTVLEQLGSAPSPRRSLVADVAVHELPDGTLDPATTPAAGAPLVVRSAGGTAGTVVVSWWLPPRATGVTAEDVLVTATDPLDRSSSGAATLGATP
jgi:hypothetical protein